MTQFMKIKDIILFSLLLFGVGNLAAQQIQNNILVNGAKASQKADKLTVELLIDASKSNINTHEAVILTPSVKDGDRQKELEPVVVYGNNRYKADKRAKKFNQETIIPSSISFKKNESSAINYQQTIPYEGWMQTATVSIKQEIVGCADCKSAESWSTLLNSIELENIEKPKVEFIVSYVTPKAEAVKSRNKEGTAYLEFPVGKSVILTDFRNNFRELKKIEDVMDQVKDNKNATIASITLKGFASPEGRYETNSRLSESRAQALKDYLQNRYSFGNEMFSVSSVAEDWDGLKKLVEESNLSDKANILDIINSSITEDLKEQKLKALTQSYKIMLSEYFPLLRHVDYKLNYTIRAFSVEEGKTIIKTSPGEMSLNEMFLVANTYQKGSRDFNEIFDIAVRLYPQDVVANLNAAAIELSNNNISGAHRYLDKYSNVSDSWNNQAILYALEGNLPKAREFFTKALQEGSQEAVQNIEKLEQLEAYERMMEERSKK